MESLIETTAATILEFLQGLKGTLCVTFEEGTSAVAPWYDAAEEAKWSFAPACAWSWS